MDTSTTPVQSQENTTSSIPNSIPDSTPITTPDNKLEKISFIILLITIFISPLAFVHTNYAPIDTAKTIVIAFGILISCVIYAISSLKEKKITIPGHPLIITGGLIILSTVISALLSTNVQKSIIGQGFEVSTASFLILMFVASFFISRSVSKHKDRLLLIYGAFITSFLILVIFHIVRLFIDPSFFNFGIFNSASSTLIGKWDDLGIFAGILFIISFFATKLLSFKRNIKILLYILIVLSGFIMLVVNSSLLWIVLSVVFLAYGIFQFLQTPASGTGLMKIISRISTSTLAFLIICVLFAWQGNYISSLFRTAPLIEQTNISLPWQLTLDITTDTIKQKPLFGAGPNRFGSEFLLHKPLVINNTPFWNVEFNTGFAFLPSFFVTHGIVGGILWIIFLVFFFSLGIKSLKHTREGFSHFAMISSFFSASFLWILSCVYNPSHVIIFFTFVMTGIFIAMLSSEMIIKDRTYGIEGNLLSKKLIMPFIIFSIAILVIWVLMYIKKTVAISYFQSGISALNLSQNQGIDKALSDFKTSLAWDKSDIYYQALSEANIIKITALAQELQAKNQKDPKTLDQGLVKKVSSLIEEAISFTRNAISIDPTNYYNYVAEARISEIALSLKVPNAYENAKTAYTNALTFNPYNPSLYLSLARMETSQNKLDEAQKYIGNSLQLKSNYTEAIFLLSQIQVTQGKIKEAIVSTQVATQINPENPLLFFQLGFLYYNDKNYQSAIDSLTKAIELNNQYANARYFLGLSYARLGKNAEATAQFEELIKTNPENQEVADILSNLRSNRTPFSDVQPPIDNKPESRKTLPVKENN